MMGLARDHGCWLKLAICLAAACGLLAGAAHAQSGGMGTGGMGAMPGNRMSSAGEDRWEKKSSVREDANTGGETTNSVEPYHGQVYCPVTGGKLGLTQPALPVQTTIGATNPGFIARLFGKKATPGAVIYVCCPKCAEAVRQNPQQYLGVVVNDMASLSTFMHYANAPPLNPEHHAEPVIPPAAYSSVTGTPAP